MSGWNKAAWQSGWTRRAPGPKLRQQQSETSWSILEILVLLGAFFIRWEAGAAFLCLKLWQQASNHGGSVFSFANEKWDLLVDHVRRLAMGSSLTTGLASRSTFARVYEDQSFERWRQDELARVDGERDRLRSAEADATAYRDDLARAQDHADFERMMRTRRRGQ